MNDEFATEKMYLSPNKLEDLCLEYISSNIQEFTVRKPQNFVNSQPILSQDDKDEITLDVYQFKRTELYLFSELAEKLFAKFNDKQLLCDELLLLFTNENTKLGKISIGNSRRRITRIGLKMLKTHKLTHLECEALEDCCITDVLDNLNEWTLKNLHVVNFSNCTFTDMHRHTRLMVKLTNLTNLKVLNLSYTELNQHMFQMLCEDLKFLQRFNVSGTRINDLAPLKLLTTTLKYLFISDLPRLNNFQSTLAHLDKLILLDLSIWKEKHLTNQNLDDLFAMNDEQTAKFLPNLQHFDLSGYKDNISTDKLINFLNHHPKIRLLGLVLTENTFEPFFAHRAQPFAISGFANEQQIIMTLKMYGKRSSYIQKGLYHLFQLTNTELRCKDDIFRLILTNMRRHYDKFSVQMASTACLYNLTKNELSKKLHPQLLRETIELTLGAMEMFPHEFQLQKNALLTLCNDLILQEIEFDRFKCCQLVLNALIQHKNDLNIIRMSVAIVSILAAKIGTRQTSYLGSNRIYMKFLLDLVEERIKNRVCDVTLKFTLSCLWNLTDESAATCSQFLQQQGGQLYLKVLKEFKGEMAVETKVLGLLNNIAEVMELRVELLALDGLVEELWELMGSGVIDVSYFAAGIVAHLASEGEDMWQAGEGSQRRKSRKEMLDELERVVWNWKVPDGEMVAYRSFRPFFPLLKPRTVDGQVQLWAVWAVHHVCTKNPKRYCKMLQEENGDLLLKALIDEQTTNQGVRMICQQILDTIELDKY